MARKNQRGVTMVEILVVSVILSGLGMVVMKLFEMQVTTEKRAETAFQINTSTNLVSQLLLNSNACINTLGGVGSNIVNGAVIPNILNRENNVVNISGARVSIADIRLTNLNLVPVGAGLNQFGDVTIRITYQKPNALNSNNLVTINKDFPLRIETGPAPNNALIQCYSATENAVDTAKIQAGANLNGTFNPVADVCNTNYVK